MADSASGKSNYAENMFTNPFVITVEDSEYLDLREFDKTINDGIVLDNVNSCCRLLTWREALQARTA